MKPKILTKTAITIMLLMIYSSGMNAQHKAGWMNTVTIDGQASDWGDNINNFDRNSKLKFSTANNDKFLYLIFQASDEPAQMKLMGGGISIALKTKVKPKITATFVLKGKMPDPADMAQARESKDRQEMAKLIKELYLMSKPTIETEGLIKHKTSIECGAKDDLAFQIKWDENSVMNLELRIPLKELFGDDYKLEEINTKDILMVVTPATNDNDGTPPRGMREGGPMGGMPPGGMSPGAIPPGEMPSGQMGMRSDFKYLIKYNFLLAVKP